jgi:hypothetical protein
MIAHPDLANLRVRPKELHFFDHFMSVQDIDIADYHQYFARPEGELSGEWTPRYMFDYWTAPMLQMTAPHTKLLVLLRDPVQRYLSGIALRQWLGFAITPTQISEQVGRSLYGQQIRHLLAHFPREQLLVLQYEQCLTDPGPALRRTFEFIGADPADCPPPEDRREAPAVRPAKPVLHPASRNALRQVFRADLEPVFDLYPELDITLWDLE